MRKPRREVGLALSGFLLDQQRLGALIADTAGQRGIDAAISAPAR